MNIRDAPTQTKMPPHPPACVEPNSSSAGQRWPWMKFEASDTRGSDQDSHPANRFGMCSQLSSILRVYGSDLWVNESEEILSTLGDPRNTRKSFLAPALSRPSQRFHPGLARNSRSAWGLCLLETGLCSQGTGLVPPIGGEIRAGAREICRCHDYSESRRCLSSPACSGGRRTARASGRGRQVGERTMRARCGLSSRARGTPSVV